MRAVFGGAIAMVLLGLYVHLIWVAHRIVGANPPPVDQFNTVMAQTLNVIGGLVSALVIAELAVTKPGQAPVARVLAGDASPMTKKVVTAVTIAYVLVWLFAGLAAFVQGMYHPTVLPALTGVGQSWLGLAVAAAYAYFGLKPGEG